MKKFLLAIFLLVCASASAQSVVTNWIYQNTYITNNIYTVSNTTHIVYEVNQITNVVNQYQYYNRYYTNTYNYVTNYYFYTQTNTTIYATNDIYVVTNIVERYTNEIHDIISIETNTYYNIYAQTNLVINIVTNYTTYITLTNFEQWARMCALSESNAMMYAYVANDAALRLGSTNAIAFTTNSYVYVDAKGREYPNILCLACNNMNGTIQASSSSQGSQSYASREYTLLSHAANSSTYQEIGRLVASHAMQTPEGMKLVYLPTNLVYRQITGNTRYWTPSYLLWYTNRLYVSLSGFTLSGGMYSYDSTVSGYIDDSGWPANIINTDVYARPSTKLQIGTQLISIRTSTPNTGDKIMYFPSFPTLDGWRYMWWITNEMGAQLR